MPDRPSASAAARVPAAAPAAATAEATAAERPDVPGDGAAPAGDRAPAPPGGGRRWLALAVRLLTSKPFRWGFVAVAVTIGVYAVASEWTQVRSGLADLGVVAVAGALLSVLAALFAAALSWRVLLAALGSPLPVRSAARIMFIGQLGKYLPGAIWPVLAQMELGTAHNVPRHRSASASVLAMLLTLLAGLLVALVTLPFVPGSGSYRWVFLVAPVLLVCLYPKVLNLLLGRLLRLARRPPLDQPLAGRAIAGALGWSLVSWACYGLQIWLLVTRLGAPYGKAALLAAGAFAFAWCVGFVIVFLPVGTGVRDALLAAMLSPMIGVGKAFAVALVSRILLTAGDLITAAAAAGFGRPPGKRAS
jgi:hypothetical protein